MRALVVACVALNTVLGSELQYSRRRRLPHLVVSRGGARPEPSSLATKKSSRKRRKAHDAESSSSQHKKMSGFELASCLVADLSPHGMLPLAWAASSGAGTGSATAVVLILAFGAVGTYTLYLCSLMDEGGAPALSTVWSSAGLPFPTVIDALVALLCGGCCVFYAAFAADLFHALTRRLIERRFVVLAALLAMPLAPLCLGDDLSVLKYSSYAGLAGVFYASCYLLGVGLSASPRNKEVIATVVRKNIWRHDPIKITLRQSPYRVTAGSAVLLNALVVAFLCHYNALQYYRELRDPKTPEKYAKVAGAASLVTTLVFAASLVGGKLAFGESAKPNVLNNLEPGFFSTLAKLGTGVAILSGFPLMFAGLKAALDAALNLTDDQRDRWWGTRKQKLYAASLLALGVLAAVATEDDIGKAIELLGSTLGCAAVYVVPGLAAFRSHTLPRHHRHLGAAVALLGAIFALTGTYHALAAASSSHGG